MTKNAKAKNKVRNSVKQNKQKHKKPFKLKKCWKYFFTFIIVCFVVGLCNKATFKDFDAKTLDYSLEFPDQSVYYNLVLEAEECSTLEKYTVGKLARQKEAPVLCTYKDSIPRATEVHLDNFTNVYIVGDVEPSVIQSLENHGLKVKCYRGVFGLLKIVY